MRPSADGEVRRVDARSGKTVPRPLLDGMSHNCSVPIHRRLVAGLTIIAMDSWVGTHIDQSRRSSGRQPRVGGIHRG